MNRAPVRPGAPRPAGRFPSPRGGWGFQESPRGGSPQGRPQYSPGSPRCSAGYSPGSWRGNMDASPVRFGSRGFGGHMEGRGGSFRRPRPFSPSGSPNFQSRSSAAPVDKYFSPSMLQDPWEHLKPVSASAAAARRST